MRTYKYKIKNIPTSELEKLNSDSASVWNECLKLKDVWNYAHGYSYTSKECELWLDKQLTKSQQLHSQSIQDIRQRYFKGWQGFFGLRKKGDKKSKPPHKQKRYTTTTWKKSAIQYKDGMLRLSNGKDNKPLSIPLPVNVDIDKISVIHLVFNNGQYELHFVYKTEDVEQIESDGVMSVDIGEIHPMVCHDGVDTTLFNGRYIRSLYRLRNKVIASFQERISKCVRGSKRFKTLVKRKWKNIRTIDNQIKDCLHKHTTTFVKLCSKRGIGTIVLGDLTNIRDDVDYRKKSNQKIHQWAFGKITNLITYKAKRLGIKVKLINESYTSQTCPKCMNRKKVSGREYKCKCGFTYHRDGIGAINIYKKYQGCFNNPVAGPMAVPFGIKLDVPKSPYKNKECS